jgi:hypothetical protein
MRTWGNAIIHAEVLALKGPESMMKTLRTLVVLLMALASATAFVQSDAQKLLEKFKSMVGTWEGKNTQDDAVVDTYRLAAGGTAVMSENKMGSEDMLSLFYVDGDHLLMTHFCPSGSQPRMRATISPGLKTVSFDFFDATNLPDSQKGHMSRAVYFFPDADHYTEEWTWMQDGKGTTFHFEMQRKK